MLFSWFSPPWDSAISSSSRTTAAALLPPGAPGPLAERVHYLFGALIILFGSRGPTSPSSPTTTPSITTSPAPAEWWRAGAFTFLRDNVYTNFPQNTEMLYLLAMECFGGPMVGAVVGQQVGVGFVLLTAAGIAACGRRLHSRGGGAAPAGRCFSPRPCSPALRRSTPTSFELPMTAYDFLVLLRVPDLAEPPAGDWLPGRLRTGCLSPYCDAGTGTFSQSEEGASPLGQRWLCAVLCGTMIGLAIGCKYLRALAFVLLPILAFVIAQGVVRLDQFPRTLAETALVGAVALATASPWLVRNAVDTRNPVYPLLYSVFDGRNWSPQQDAKFRESPPDRRQQPVRPDASLRLALLALHPLARPARDGMGNPPAAPLLLLFGLIPIVMGDRRSTRVPLCFAVVFLGARGHSAVSALTASTRKPP